MVIEEISNAISLLSLKESEISRLNSSNEQAVYYELVHHFVAGDDRRWWWESFKEKSISVDCKDGKGFKRITEIVPNKKETVWFVAEDDQLPNYPIYDATPEVIQKIIGECFAFEYYIIPQNKEWLLCENHHNTLIGVGDKITANLYKIA